MCETEDRERHRRGLYNNSSNGRSSTTTRRAGLGGRFRRNGSGGGGAAVTTTTPASPSSSRTNANTAVVNDGTKATTSTGPTVMEPYKVYVSIRFLVTSLLASCLLAFCVGRASRILMLGGMARRTDHNNNIHVVNESYDNNESYKTTVTHHPQLPHQQQQQGGTTDMYGSSSSSVSNTNTLQMTLPSIIAKNAAAIPPSRYLSKNFDTSMSVSSSSWLSASRTNVADVVSTTSTSTTKDQQDSQPQQPMAEHLMVDIKHVDGTFLNSEQQLAYAIIQVVTEANLTLLSYHCHGLLPMGVSCVGVLQQNYISFHTWPEEGVITLDLCVGMSSFEQDVQHKSRALLPVLPILERAFGKPQQGRRPRVAMGESGGSSSSTTTTPPMPEMRWAHRVRGFPKYDADEDENDDVTAQDLGLYVLGDLAADVKEEIYSGETNFQKLDIYDVEDLNHEHTTTAMTDPSHFGRRSKDTRHPVVFRPDRVVMRNGWVESSLFHEAAYHEALVHPAMMAHTNPKRIAIVGGGEGASLREVLKHKTVEEATVIEMDESIVFLSKEHMPEWSDCSDYLETSSEQEETSGGRRRSSDDDDDDSWWCFQDPRTRLYHEDALTWFVNRYQHYHGSTDADKSDHKEGKDKNKSALLKEDEQPPMMDVVILNALSAESESVHADALYSNATYMQSFYNSLSENGILVLQLGESPDSWAADEMVSGDTNRVAAFSLLEEVGFESIQTFEESHCGFGAAWTFIVAFKSYASRKHWYANAAEIDLAIQKRIVKTKSGVTPLRYFDGATMVSYQMPSRTLENVFCRRQPTPVGCHTIEDLSEDSGSGGEEDDEEDDDHECTFDPAYPNVPLSSLEVKTSSVGDNAGRGVFTKVDIAKHTYISAETASQSLRFYPSTYALILELLENCPEQADALDAIEYYMHGYGFTSRFFGAFDAVVDSSIITFINHGCKGSYNVGERTFHHEFSANLHEMIEDVDGKSHTGTAVFNPVVDRHLFYSGDMSIRDIRAGEELFDNYLAFIGGEEYWEADVSDLRNQCSGIATEGSVTEYEDTYRENENE